MMMVDETHSNLIDKKIINELKKEFNPIMVDSVVENYHLFPPYEDFVRYALTGDQSKTFVGGFLRANVARREAEAAMVAEEVGIFGEIRKLMSIANENYSDANAGDMKTSVTEPIEAASKLISSLAAKNSTMGEGIPETPGGKSPPEEPEIIPQPNGGAPNNCYVQYRQELANWHLEKSSMQWDIAFSSWVEITGRYLRCIGEGALSYIELIKKFREALKE